MPNAKLKKIIEARGLSYDIAAEQIRHVAGKHKKGEAMFRLSGAWLGQIARKARPPSLRVAKAIVAWVGSPRDLKIDDLINLS